MLYATRVIFNMNLVDPELEFIDPTPNVHSLFVHFDMAFFWTTLLGRATVRWSKRMYSAAGICSYEGRGGLVDIALSEPLLKLRPRKDLVETLLHEMIHAYLFVVGRDQWRDGHGPNFLSHMHRINKAAGVNITVYHDFHDEVKLYQNHVWRCNGPCQKMRPYFGVVRRSTNRTPGPSDNWWNQHTRVCGGTFIKCNQPVEPVKKPTKIVKTPNADITKYINNNDNTMDNKNVKPKPVPKPTVFTGSGPVGGNKRSSVSVVETVRNVWANNTIPSSIAPITKKNPTVPTSQVNAKKRLSNVDHSDFLTPPKKATKIDDYFKTTASSILKDVYGKDFTVTQSSDTNKLKAVAAKETLVKCPICNAQVNDIEINRHLDECLNYNVMVDICKEDIGIIEPSKSQTSKNEIKNKRETVGAISFMPASKPLKTCSFCNAQVSDTQTNRHLDECLTYKVTTGIVQVKAEPISSNGLDLRTGIAQIKTEPSTSNCLDLKTGFVQAKAEPSSSNGLDLRTGIAQIKKEPSTSNCLDLTTGFVQAKAEPSSSNFLDHRTGIAQIKTELSTSNCVDLTTGFVQVKAEPSSTNCLDLRTGIAQIKTELSTSNYVDLTKGFVQVKAEPSSTNCLDLRIGIAQIKTEPSTSNCVDLTTGFVQVKPETSSSKSIENHTCPCCGKTIDKPVREHLDECLTFFDNNTTIPEEGASTSFADEITVIDDSGDEFDETLTLNATGTKSPCPCCMTMVEIDDMNDHLDECLRFSK